MKFVYAVLAMALLVGCATQPSAQDVQKGIKYSVIFGIRPDASGHLQELRVAEVIDPLTRKKVGFVPSRAYIAQARQTLSNGHWKVGRDDSGKIKEVFMFCFYSAVVPDDAICDARFAPKTH